MTHKNVIEINGRLYDARSGAPIDTLAPAHTSLSPIQTKVSGGRTVDGFKKNHAAKQSPVKKISLAPAEAAPKSHLKTTPIPLSTRTASAPQKASLKAKRSLTLNRSSVAAPKVKPATIATKPEKAVESPALKHGNPARFKRAQTAAQSPAISRFGDTSGGLQPEANTNINELSSAATALTKHLEATHLGHHPAAQAGSKLSSKEELIKKAVTHATSASSHTRQHTERRHRFAKYAPAVLVFLLLSGYVAYLNVPSLSMKVAAQRAGFAATMPGYKPAGYSLSGPIAASPGEVSVSFASNTDDRNFKLKQQPTTWDSTALLENLVVKKSPNYLTYQDRGLTIYIFDGSSAAWINGGRLYQVDGKNSRLDTDQLLKIATSV